MPIHTDQFIDIEEDEFGFSLFFQHPSQRNQTQVRPKKEIINRNRVEGHKRLVKDYFLLNSTYNSRMFERQFRMSKDLFSRICEDLQRNNTFWLLKADCCGQISLSPYQKMTSALRQLAYGMSGDGTNEYVRIGETTALRTLKTFVQDVVSMYSDEYLRQPNRDEKLQILAEYEERGFPGCLGSIDGMHWAWKNCPAGWAGQFQGKEKVPTMILEAVASQNLRFWHCFFGSPGALNDINVIHRSHLFDKLLTGVEDQVKFKINNHDYFQSYYLADGIYPPWSSLVKTIPHPQDDASKYYAKLQESARKDIERAFGVLQARWGIIKQPCRLWEIEDVKNLMLCCVILHNMVVESRSPEDAFLSDSNMSCEILSNHRDPLLTNNLANFYQRNHDLHNSSLHFQLRNDLKVHNWLQKGLS